MLIFNTEKIQKIFKKEVIPNISCLGVDTASRTGWCRAETTIDQIKLDYGFIDIESKDKYFKYNHYIEIFRSLINVDILVIEESFYGQNAKTFQMLSRLGGFVYAVAHINNQKHKRFLLATSARKFLGLKGNSKKAEVQKEFCKKLNLKLEDEDIIDAIILAFNGILKGEDYVDLA